MQTSCYENVRVHMLTKMLSRGLCGQTKHLRNTLYDMVCIVARKKKTDLFFIFILLFLQWCFLLYSSILVGGHDQVTSCSAFNAASTLENITTLGTQELS